MTKQEQSEKIIYGSLITSTKCYNCIHFPLCFAQKGSANLGLASENDCCYYQSKLPEDSVVLSREEYNTLKARADNKCKYDCWLIEDMPDFEVEKDIKTQSSKETAEKFLQLAYDRCLEKSFIKKVEELAKQFGVE